MDRAERLARLRLARTDGIGPKGFAQLIARFGSGAEAESALLGMGKPLADAGLAAAEVAAAQAVGARHLLLGEADYPPLLATLPDPPPVLVIRGDPALGARPVVAVVGARNASAAGRRLASEMAEGLGAAGWVVASGLARGIDGAAHEAALPTGTIACVAGGPDMPYPAENRALHAAIGEAGLILAELPPGTEPMARHFPRRNRLIAGIARAIVVIEAAPGSGSLLTARFAADAGRDVMAVPGHPLDPRSTGGNGLIRDGAALVETAADILAVLGAPPEPAARPRAHRPATARRSPPAARPPGATAATGDLLELLSVSGVAVDELVRETGLAAADINARLTDLELDGQVVRLAGGRVALKA